MTRPRWRCWLCPDNRWHYIRRPDIAWHHHYLTKHHRKD
jgi:hypothetical protein